MRSRPAFARSWQLPARAARRRGRDGAAARRRQQRALAARVVQSGADCLADLSRLELVGGLDVSFLPASAPHDAASAQQGPPTPAPGCPGGGPAGAAAGPGAPASGGAPRARRDLLAPPQEPAGASSNTAAQQRQLAGERAVAALAVMSYPDLVLRHVELMEADVTVPYIPGMLGFRWVYSIKLVYFVAPYYQQ